MECDSGGPGDTDVRANAGGDDARWCCGVC